MAFNIYVKLNIQPFKQIVHMFLHNVDIYRVLTWMGAYYYLSPRVQGERHDVYVNPHSPWSASNNTLSFGPSAPTALGNIVWWGVVMSKVDYVFPWLDT